VAAASRKVSHVARRLTVEHTTYPPLIRAANTAITCAGKLGLYTPDVTLEGMVEKAKRLAGWDDVWETPGAWEGMRHVIDNVDALGFTPFSRQIMHETFVKGLTNRALLRKHLASNPHILQIPVERPIFVLGFPRTGTTTLQNLLALHPERRGLPFWQLYSPIPLDEDWRRDVRRRQSIAKRTLAVGYAVAPEMGAVHEIRHDSLEEDWYLFWNTFRVLNWDIQTGFREYGRWLLDLDMQPSYEEVKQYLQVILDRRADGSPRPEGVGPRQLVLKCPEHLWFVDALLATFPDACIIWTHRDPVSCVASYCSLMSLTRRLIYGRFVPKEMGPYITERFHEGVTRAMEARDRWGDERSFFDVDFTELNRDPVGVMKRACEHFDLAWDDAYPQWIADWTASDREDKRGSHVYSAEAFGVDRGHVHELYRDYIERFSIPIKQGD
jgi:hypothetical protein